MQVELDINGRRRRVDVSGSGDLLTVTVDGQAFQVDARRVGAHGLSLVIGPHGPVSAICQKLSEA